MYQNSIQISLILITAFIILLPLIFIEYPVGLAQTTDQNDSALLIYDGNASPISSRSEETIKLYDKALEIEPNDVTVLTNKGIALNNLERYQEAIEYFDRVLEIEPNDVTVLTNKGIALEKLGRSQEAIEYQDRALEIDPNYNGDPPTADNFTNDGAI